MGDRSGAVVAGIAATALALGVSELLAGLFDGVPSLVISVGALAIDWQPPGAKTLVVGVFGEADKTALIAAVVVVALLIGAWVGLLSRRFFALAAIIVVAFGLVGLYAALSDPLGDPPLAVMSAGVTVLAAIVTLWLLRLVGTSRPRPAQMPDWRRRRFLGASATVGLSAVGSGVMGRYLLERTRPPAAAPPRIPPASTPAPSATPSPSQSDAPAPAPTPEPVIAFDVPGLTPIVVPNPSFYRIDVNLLTPRLDVSTWRLRLRGMVEHDIELTYEQLIAMPLAERHVTIACVSNEVGGDLVGNALWTGALLRDVLALCGVREGATQIVARAYDGWTAGFPTDIALDPGRESLVAVQMNGATLPAEHGFPARLIVPGLFGYVSATKWLTEIELTTLEAFDAYWIPLGWAKQGPILTQSRIDVPADGATISPGPAVAAGVAWAPHRGVARVEVSVDDGAWAEAELSHPLSEDAWVQWRHAWDARPGRHRLRVRATDGTGNVQSPAPDDPPPDGARGLHTINVAVRSR